ncbi:TauD/TfdA family dioxygenase [Vibrio sp. Of14-4]|uniref:TauD/TfdA family dioxygenase n=1 Tax=Vibrio sp. Of14-4 TaxID=2724878 RepID=UPI001EF1E2A3|nr:TauD/TfdA family dioxygenase [Vibrio sp. Of14-4]MCG7490560.1 TauD/TfdA family dioxygenase [Vibrio sp. Of14-4]
MYCTTADKTAISLLLKTVGFALVEGLEDEESCHQFLDQHWKLDRQYDGQLVNEVKAKKQYGNLPLSQAHGEIGPHTEGVALKKPPKYLALYCLQPAKELGETHIYDGYRVLSKLDRAQWQTCCSLPVNFQTKGNYSDESSASSCKNVVVSNEDGRVQINFSTNLFTWGDLNPVSVKGQELEPLIIEHQELFNKLLDECEKNKVSICIPENCLLIWDNHRMLHGRAAFQDKSRHLLRFWLSDKEEAA